MALAEILRLPTEIAEISLTLVCTIKGHCTLEPKISLVLCSISRLLTLFGWVIDKVVTWTTSLAWTYIKVCGYSDSFCKNLNQRSLTPRWPLTPHLLRSYVWLYPRIIVSKSHENTSKYVDTVTFLTLPKTWTKVIDPFDLWPHICCGHMCDLPKDHCVQVPWKYIKVCGYSDPFCKKKKLEPKVIDP